MAGEYSVKETKEMVSLGAGLVLAIENAYADGRFGLEDLAFLIPLAAYVQPAVDGANLIPKEVGEMDEADEKELREHIDAQFGEGKFQLIGEDALLAANHLLSAVAKLRNLGQNG